MQFSRASAKISNAFGLWLSLVEHRVRDAGVAGSNPVNPTSEFEQARADIRSGLFALLMLFSIANPTRGRLAAVGERCFDPGSLGEITYDPGSLRENSLDPGGLGKKSTDPDRLGKNNSDPSNFGEKSFDPGGFGENDPDPSGLGERALDPALRSLSIDAIIYT